MSPIDQAIYSEYAAAKQMADILEVKNDARGWLPARLWDEFDALMAVLHPTPIVVHPTDRALIKWWSAIDTTTSPALAAGKQAAEFGIRLSSMERAYIAEAVLAASGLGDDQIQIPTE